MSRNRFSNSKKVRDSVRQLAQKREWKDFPVSERLLILERVSEVIEEVLQEREL